MNSNGPFHLSQFFNVPGQSQREGSWVKQGSRSVVTRHCEGIFDFLLLLKEAFVAVLLDCVQSLQSHTQTQFETICAAQPQNPLEFRAHRLHLLLPGTFAVSLKRLCVYNSISMSVPLCDFRVFILQNIHIRIFDLTDCRQDYILVLNPEPPSEMFIISGNEFVVDIFSNVEDTLFTAAVRVPLLHDSLKAKNAFTKTYLMCNNLILIVYLQSFVLFVYALEIQKTLVGSFCVNSIRGQWIKFLILYIYIIIIYKYKLIKKII